MKTLQKFLVNKKVKNQNKFIGRYEIDIIEWNSYNTFVIKTKPFDNDKHEIEFEYWKDEDKFVYMLFTLDENGDIDDVDDIKENNPILTKEERNKFEKIFKQMADN